MDENVDSSVTHNVRSNSAPPKMAIMKKFAPISHADQKAAQILCQRRHCLVQ
jgi:hypothetical protein